MFKKIISAGLSLLILAIPAVASAHVIVTPSQANVAQELVFNVSVPNEKETAVTQLKLSIPSGVTEVIPTTKDGWTIKVVKPAGSDDATDIIWTGNIPVGQRDDFSFSAQMPASATELNWKAYQTYADGSVVSWDQKPAGSDDATGDKGPYSITKVNNDLADTSTTNKNSNSNGSNLWILLISLAALGLSVTSLVWSRRR